MKCASVGMLRGYLDGELAAEATEQVRLHVAECEKCATELKEVAATCRNVQSLLGTEIAAADSAAALAVTRRRIAAARSVSGWPSTARWYRQRAWTWLGTAAALLAVIVAMSPVRIAAEDLLSIFRVQSFAAITVDPEQIPTLSGLTGVFEPGKMMPPDIRVTSDVAAGQAVDFQVKRPQYLPAAIPNTSSSFVSQAAAASYTVNLQTAKQVLAQAGAEDVQLPASLDGATLRINVPPAVVTVFGLAEGQHLAEAVEPGKPFLVLAQTRGPVLEVPDTVDVAVLREQVLGLPLIPPDVAKQLRAIKDWRHTLVIPVRAGTHNDVSVGGAPGLLISHPNGDNTLLWQRDGVVYGLIGHLDQAELMRVANSLK